MNRVISTGNLYVVLFLVLFSVQAMSQVEELLEEKYVIDRISIDQGLSQSIVQAVFQDSKGFLWFGTQDGLNRYDGSSFNIYRFEPGNTNSLSNGSITAVCEDRRGNLWVGTLAGLNMISGSTITRYLAIPSNPNSLSSDNVTCLASDSVGHIWIGTSNGLCMYDPESNNFVTYKNDPTNKSSLCDNNINSVIVDRNNDVWAGTNNGLARMNVETRNSGQFTIYRNDHTNLRSLSDNTVFCVYEDNSGTIYVGTRKGGLNRFDRSRNNFVSFKNDPRNPWSVAQNAIYAISQDFYGNLWLGTASSGVSVFRDGRCVHFKHDPGNQNSLSNDEVAKLLCDRSGTIWIGTNGGGVCKFRESRFKTYRHAIDMKNSLSGDDIWAVYEDTQRNLWVGIYNAGLDIVASGRVINYKHDPRDSKSLSGNTVYAICQDTRGYVWLGTESGLHRCQNGSNINRLQFDRISHDPTNTKSLTHNQITCIFQDRKGNIWVGTVGGLNRIHVSQLSKSLPVVDRIKKDDSNNSIADDFISAIAEDSSGHLWFGTQNGLTEFDGKRFRTYRNDPLKENSISQNIVLSLYVDKSNTLWIGTFGGGLNCLKNDTFTKYTQKDGFSNNVIYSIVGDSLGRLWLSTNKGISCFDPNKNGSSAFRNFDLRDGLPTNEYNQGSFAVGYSGDVFFGGINGLVQFDPLEVTESNFVPPVYFTGFKKFDKIVDLGQDITDVKEIKISYKDNFIGFQFVGLDYRIPQKVRYAYKLDGFDKDWIYSDSRNEAYYTNLDGGNYTFNVKAMSSDGLWNEKGASVKLKISPPIWDSWLFRICVGLIISLVGYVLYRRKIDQIQFQKEELEVLVKERTLDLRRKTIQLEKIDLIVKAISSEIDLPNLLQKILQESTTIKGVERASALLFDSVSNRFHFKSSWGWKLQDLETITLSKEEAERRYTHDGEEVFEDVFVIRNLSGRAGSEKMTHLDTPMSMLTVRIKNDEGILAYFIFDNMHVNNAFNKQDIELVNNLREHIALAFMKSKILDEIQTMNALITKQNIEIQDAYNRLKDTELQLIQSEKMASLGQLTAGIAHEINNPVNFINAGIKSLKRDIDEILELLNKYSELHGIDNPKDQLAKIVSIRESLGFNDLIAEINELTSGIQEGANRTTEIVKNLKNFARADESDFKLSNVNELLDSTLLLLRNQYKNRIEIVKDYDPDSMAECYPGPLNQVFMNILVNAFQAIPDNGKVFISTKSFTDSVMIRIKDDGIGMTDDVKKRIFDPFFTTKDVGKGTGLGLSMSYGIIEKHGGTIKVESSIGKGSEFTIQIPSSQNLNNKKTIKR